MKNYRLLYVDDDREISNSLAQNIVELHTTHDSRTALELFKLHQPDVIIFNVMLPDSIKVIEKIREFDSDVPLIIISSQSQNGFIMDAVKLKIDGCLVKPLNSDDLLQMIDKTVEPKIVKTQLESANKKLSEMNRKFDDIVEKKTKELEYIYSHEQITGLENFIKLNENIDSMEYKYLLLLDISNFTVFNKQYGKIFSNEILRKAAQELQEHMKSNSKLFKIESDKYVVLTKEDKLHEIEILCKQIVGYFDIKPLNINNIEIFINFAIGIERIHENAYPLINAEYAIDVAKEVGGRFYHLYNEKDDSIAKATYEIGWLNITKEMIKNNKIKAFYQPIMDIKTGEIVKYEVLARGNYNGKDYSPEYFIGSAESLGFIDSITRIMINNSFKLFSGTDMEFSVNLTTRDLLDEYFISFLEDKIALYDIKISQVTMEVLENITIGKRQTKIIKMLKKLKSMGFKIAIDDFGVENSNFSRLLEIKFDFIKFDAIFIKNIHRNKNDRTIVTAIVNMAKSLGIKTVAEYVESKEILDVLDKTGIDLAQGYFIGEPQPYLLT